MIFQSRLRKYAVYAFGEILLVVVGILIALNVNNWNEMNKNIKISNDYLNDLKIDLKTDTTIFGAELKAIKNYISYLEWGLKLDDFSNVPIADIEGLAATSYHNIEMNSGTYIRMQQAEIWDLKDFKSLFKDVNTYYTFYKTYLENYNDWEQNLYSKSFEFWYLQNEFEVEFQHMDSIPLLQKDVLRKERIVKQISSVQGRNMLKTSLMREQGMLSTYEIIYEEAVRLLQRIELHQSQSIPE
jgi:hypothetical protein